MNAEEIGLIQTDQVAAVAMRIFEWRVSQDRSEETPNYRAEANRAIQAAEAFYEAAFASNHMKYRGTLGA